MTLSTTLTLYRELLPEGYRMRPATMRDVERVTAMLNAWSRDYYGRDEHEVPYFRNEWRTPGFNLETDTRLIEAPDGSVAAWMEIWDRSPHVKVWTWGRVHPAHRGMGLGTILREWAEERAREAIALAPEGAQVSMETAIPSDYAAADELLKSVGMEVNRYFWEMAVELESEPPTPQWPDGITARALDHGEAEREVFKAVRASFRDHWGYVEGPFEEDYERWEHSNAHDPDYDPSLRFIALDGDRIAGVSLCWPHNFDDKEKGWVGTLGVLRAWRRKGVALALLHHSFGEFYRRGQKRVGLGVDAASLTGATLLYEKAGMHVERKFTNYKKVLREGEVLSTQTLDDEK